MTKYVKVKGDCGGCGREDLMVSAVPPKTAGTTPRGECDDCAALRVSRHQKAVNASSQEGAILSRERWDEADDDRLWNMYENGESVKFIAEDLGRSYAAIRTRVRHLGVTR